MTIPVKTASGAARASALQAACSSWGLELPPDQVEALTRFNELLQRWNAVYNLTSVRDLDAALTTHVLDCLAAVPPLRRQLVDVEGPAVLDVGSGGGLPGVVFAITNPAIRVVCVDAVGKKAAFVTQAAADLQLRNLTSVHRRVEALAGSFDLIVSRAFASLAELVRLTDHLLSSSGLWMAMKGKEPSREIAELPNTVSVFHVEHLRVPGLVGDRCLVWIRPPHQSSGTQ